MIKCLRTPAAHDHVRFAANARPTVVQRSPSVQRRRAGTRNGAHGRTRQQMRLSAKSLLIKDFLPPGAAGRLWCVNSADVLGVGVVLLAGGEDLGDVLHGPLRE